MNRSVPGVKLRFCDRAISRLPAPQFAEMDSRCLGRSISQGLRNNAGRRFPLWSGAGTLSAEESHRVPLLRPLMFYDRSKSHARRWCSMAVCGNRAKATAHRVRDRRARSAQLKTPAGSKSRQ